MKKVFFVYLFILSLFWVNARNVTDYVDPRIGTEGLGRTFIGASLPYGMIKPGPDAVSMPNSGWSPMPEPIKGFSQVHVSGTGGGQKYGNILLMPYVAVDDRVPMFDVTDTRRSEDVSLCFYQTLLSSGVNVRFTCADRAAIYKIRYPLEGFPGLIFDAGAFLGMSDIPDQRETQQLVGSQIEVVNDHAVQGYNRVRGGWNNGRAYTVYFYAECDQPFLLACTKEGDDISGQWARPDRHKPTAASVIFDPGTLEVNVKIGISFVSELKAKENLITEIPRWSFHDVHTAAIDRWQTLLSRISISESASEEQKRMFYTALYHTMIMPVDRSGENPLWADDSPYYDDYYAIWDTYRTSTPLITLINPERERDIVNSLINIYRRDGYMPDARSGNSNGRTQGGSNAEIVIADAYVKGLVGIDYDLALEAMLKDAEVPPGGIEEAEGRGGLREYLDLGYVPFGIPRAGNRTVEYSFCDYAIAQVAKGLGKDAMYDRYMRQSSNWRNLWRDDYEHSGVKGFIMPRDRNGAWLDSLPQGHSNIVKPNYEYTAMTFEGPWYTPWWSMFFYEAPSWEYSLSVPHDVPGLIEQCGGAEAFEHRLDTFFDMGYYNVNNEPSFLSPCLYHWIGKPWRSSDRIHQIVAANYNDSSMGLPGNDDSGAMSSWLAFHMMGLYPNAGHDYYLINTPMIERTDFNVGADKTFSIVAEDFTPENRYIQAARLDGRDYPYSSIRHCDIAQGGVLTLVLGPEPSEWGKNLAPASSVPHYDSKTLKPAESLSAPDNIDFSRLQFVFTLHAQTRRYTVSFDCLDDGSALLRWGIERNLKWQQGSYLMSKQAVELGTMLDLSMPIDGADVVLPADMTSYIISREAFKRLKDIGKMTYNGIVYRLASNEGHLLHVIDDVEHSQMWILDNETLPVIWRMVDNPLEVDWTVRPLKN